MNCDVEKFSTQDSSEKTIAILGDRWRSQKAKQAGDILSRLFNVMNALILEVVSLLGVRAVVRLERDAWSTIK